MRLLALDPATKLGWAIYDKGKWRSGTIDLSNKKWDGAGVRFVKFEQWLHEQKPMDIIVYEAVENHGSDGTYAAHAYGGYIAVLQRFGEANSIAYTGLPVGSIKKFWTGNGRAGKEKMIEEARRRKFNPKDDNEADAIAIGHYGLYIFKDLLT